MHLKKAMGLIIGALICITGIILISYANQYKQQISEAKQDIDFLTKPIDNNPVGKMFKKSLQAKAGQYDSQVAMLYYTGLFLTISGLAVLIFFVIKKFHFK